MQGMKFGYIFCQRYVQADVDNLGNGEDAEDEGIDPVKISAEVFNYYREGYKDNCRLYPIVENI